MNYPFIRNNKISPDTIEVFTIDDFSGGINNYVTPMLVKANEAVDMLNISLKNDEKRKGTTYYDDLILDDKIVYMDVYKPINLPEVLIRATETEVYAGDSKICDTEGEIKGVNYIGNYYFTDGVNFYQYNGSKTYKIVSDPTARLTNNNAVNSTVLAIKKWDERIKIGVKGQIEGINGFDEFTISDIDKNSLTITIEEGLTYEQPEDTLVRFYIPKGDTYYSGDYKTDDILNLKWYEPCKHELDDIYKGENFLPKNCTTITLDSERIYLAGDSEHPNEIYISDINNPFYFPVNLGMQCPPSGDKIIDLITFDNGVVVGRNNDIHVIYGETANLDFTNNLFNMKRFDTHTGFSSKNNAKEVNNYLFFLGYDGNVYGMHTIQANNEMLATTIINKDKVDLSKNPFNITKEDLKNVPSIYYEDEYYLAFDNMVVVYNYMKRAWTKYTGWNASFFLIKDNELLIGTKDGRVLKLTDEYNDCGKAIECFYKTGQFNLGKAMNYKNFLDMFAVTHAYNEFDSSLKIMALVDYDEIKSSNDIINALSRFGITTFGEILVATNIAQSKNVPINVRGRIISFVFSNDKLNEPMKVYQISVTYILRGTR